MTKPITANIVTAIPIFTDATLPERFKKEPLTLLAKYKNGELSEEEVCAVKKAATVCRALKPLWDFPRGQTLPIQWVVEALLSICRNLELDIPDELNRIDVAPYFHYPEARALFKAAFKEEV